MFRTAIIGAFSGTLPGYFSVCTTPKRLLRPPQHAPARPLAHTDRPCTSWRSGGVVTSAGAVYEETVVARHVCNHTPQRGRTRLGALRHRARVSECAPTQRDQRLMRHNACPRLLLARQRPSETSLRRTVCLNHRTSSRATVQDRAQYGGASCGAARASVGTETGFTGWGLSPYVCPGKPWRYISAIGPEMSRTLKRWPLKALHLPQGERGNIRVS